MCFIEWRNTMQILDKLAYKVLKKKSKEDIKKLFNIECSCKKKMPVVKREELKTKTLQSTSRIDRYDMRVMKDYKETIRKEIAYDLVDTIKDLLEIEILEDNNTYRVYKGTLRVVKER